MLEHVNPDGESISGGQAPIFVLHMFGQEAWHDDAYMIGNVNALIALRGALTEAIESGKGSAEVMTSDGEGYSVKVVREDSDWQGEKWRKIGLPYMAEYAKERREDATWPWHL